MYQEQSVHYPQSEIHTLLVPVTTGCQYNMCAFCSMYKEDTYSEVSLRDIELELMNGDSYTERVFLTGADPLSIGYEKMMRVLKLIQKYFPYCGCVAAYAAVKTIRKYSVEELSALHLAGLRLLYVGFETGNDEALKLMKKGHTAKQEVETGKKLNQARMPFYSIVMYGIAGHGNGVENAKKTAAVLNEFDTAKVITMNLTVFETTKLSEMVKTGEFIQAGQEEKRLEIKTLLESLNPARTTEFDTTHTTNIVKIAGKLPEERAKLIASIPCGKEKTGATI